jgi:hypothetical protein
VLHRKLYTEEERIQFSNGQCFGEWAIINKTKRSGAALALTACELFYLEKEDFEKHFSKCISKAETDRKEFLVSVFPFLASNLKLDEHYQRMIPLFLTKNDIIYREKGRADSLYLIYSGECILKKNFKSNLSFDYFSVKNMKTVLQLSSSQVAGLESLFKDTYDNTFIANSEYTIVFKIGIAEFNEYKMLFKSLYEQLYRERKLLIEKFTKNHMTINKMLKVHYRSQSANTMNFVMSKKREDEQLKVLNNLIDSVKGNGPKGKLNEVPMERIKFLPEGVEGSINNPTSHRTLELPASNTKTEFSKSFISRYDKPQSSYNATITTGINSLKNTIEKKLNSTTRKGTYSKSFINISEFNNKSGTLNVIPKSHRGKRHFMPIQKENEIFTLNTGTFNLPMISMFKK